MKADLNAAEEKTKVARRLPDSPLLLLVAPRSGSSSSEDVVEKISVFSSQQVKPQPLSSPHASKRRLHQA